MTEHEHEHDADRLERELDDMQHQSERLEGEISEARSDWENKQRDESVPGAVDRREPEGPAEPDPERQQRPDEDD